MQADITMNWEAFGTARRGYILKPATSDLTAGELRHFPPLFWDSVVGDLWPGNPKFIEECFFLLSVVNPIIYGRLHVPCKLRGVEIIYTQATDDVFVPTVALII